MLITFFSSSTQLFHIMILRFQKSTEWRSKPVDPNDNNENTLKADSWKSKMSTLTALHAKKKRQSNAPEAALLRPTSTSTSSRKLHLARSTVFKTPKEGVSAVPLTLSDGTQVYVPLRAASNNPSFSCSSQTNHHLYDDQQHNNNNPLGVSMKDLMARSEQIRRRAEHTKRTMQEREEKTTSSSKSHKSSKHKTVGVDDQLWVDKHAPSSFPHLLSDERTNREVLRALRAWDPYVFGRDHHLGLPFKHETTWSQTKQRQAPPHLQPIALTNDRTKPTVSCC